MGWLASCFKPKSDNFIGGITKQAEINVAGVEGLVAYMKDPTPENAQQVNQAEKNADEVRRMLVDELNRTFVTPIDREDIFELSRAVDDLMDYAHTTVEEMIVLNVRPNESLIRMAELMRDAVIEIHLAMTRLETHPGVANDHARAAKRVENDMKRCYHRAIAEMFSGPATPESIMTMLKMREVLRHLSRAADRVDDAANVLSDIVVKMT
jgi:predicted phosphate transport protein (TIGR00153 family)